ncbi:MAG TPA: DNA polymerase Y family protein [Thermoanaerobaculia bacterium]|jgi:protein ImuB|nr:DNA polymerase Y family protein [Thermoanaerobaculia bacterium]
MSRKSDADRSRLACLFVPLFPLAARLRSEPELIREALAILEGNGQAARVVAATRAARAAGVRPGLSLPQARALCPKLAVRARDATSERAAEEALIEVADAFSPRVESARDGTVFLDLDGIPHASLRGAAAVDPAALERALGQDLAAAADAAGLPARVGIASSKLAARVAAGLPGSPVIVPAGEEAAFLAPLPLARLAPQVDLSATLERWGVRSIGDFARLPSAEVASRLGRSGSELHTVARGLDPHPLVPREPPPTFEEGMSLEWPLATIEPFLFIGRAALERLTRRLESAGLACLRLELDLALEPEGNLRRSIELPAPSRDVKTLLSLIRLDLEANPPGAPVIGFVFRSHPDRPREAQLSLLGPAALSPDRLAATLARLFALLGPERVGSPRPTDGHRPERAALVAFAPPPPPLVRERAAERQGRGLLGVRALRPPLPLEVITEGPGPNANPEAASNAAPARPIEVRPVVGGAGEDAVRRLEIRGGVRVAAGPWALEEGWWTDDPADREYWDVELFGGSVYRLFRDRTTGDWFADGIYD